MRKARFLCSERSDSVGEGMELHKDRYSRLAGISKYYDQQKAMGLGRKEEFILTSTSEKEKR